MRYLNCLSDLFKVHCIVLSAGVCGSSLEDHKHFFFDCTKYNNRRTDLIGSLKDFSHEVNTSLVTSGHDHTDLEEN